MHRAILIFRSFKGSLTYGKHLLRANAPTYKPSRVRLPTIHPRLFLGFILAEPIIQSSPPSGMNVARSSSYRPDFDPRVLDKILIYGKVLIPITLAKNIQKCGLFYVKTLRHMNRTGNGLGDNGGVKMGVVEKSVFENRGHMAPLEDGGGRARMI
ncbi:hypothetical protein EAF04_007025 [Stromatinia cepivora]|nr:hypothetical protein EAF04_007025 [Stromatinia cepivora]